jgi:SAM-dependent methyltransferase
MADWTQKLFNQMYVKTEGLAASTQVTRQECGLAVELLDLQVSDQILDLACGHGRHSIELARQGFENIIGLDFNSAALEYARADAVGTKAQFVLGDMMALTCRQEFDVILSFFNSIFYWNDQTHLQILQGIHLALRPNGRLFLDSHNPFFIVHRKLTKVHPVFGKFLAIRKQLGIWKAWLKHTFYYFGQPRKWHETTGQFDPITGLIRGTIHMHVGSEYETHPLEMRLYTFTELEKLLEQAGFRVEKVVSNTGNVFTNSSPRYVVVARKK